MNVSIPLVLKEQEINYVIALFWFEHTATLTSVTCKQLKNNFGVFMRQLQSNFNSNSKVSTVGKYYKTYTPPCTSAVLVSWPTLQQIHELNLHCIMNYKQLYYFCTLKSEIHKFISSTSQLLTCASHSFEVIYGLLDVPVKQISWSELCSPKVSASEVNFLFLRYCKLT